MLVPIPLATALRSTLVPGGGGVKEILYRWHERLGDINKAAWQTFMNIGYGKTAGSPVEAEPLAMFRDGIDDYVMNKDRLLVTRLHAEADALYEATAHWIPFLACQGGDQRGPAACCVRLTSQANSTGAFAETQE